MVSIIRRDGGGLEGGGKRLWKTERVATVDMAYITIRFQSGDTVKEGVRGRG